VFYRLVNVQRGLHVQFLGHLFRELLPFGFGKDIRFGRLELFKFWPVQFKINQDDRMVTLGGELQESPVSEFSRDFVRT